MHVSQLSSFDMMFMSEKSIYSSTTQDKTATVIIVTHFIKVSDLYLIHLFFILSGGYYNKTGKHNIIC